MDEKSALALRNSISHLAFPLSPPSPRRSTRSSGSVKVDVKEEPSSPSKHVSSPKKRKMSQHDSDGESPKKKNRPMKRGYADPATYAHLKALNDYLAPDLDVIFCGINPGQMSATKGHHFANPTNHFWKGLHLSGFTPRLLSPSEDSTLPALYNIGMTNLVERPSAEQAELSKEEMKLSVPSLKAKVIRYHPHIVCFVGKGIWLVVEAAFKKQIRNDDTAPCAKPVGVSKGTEESRIPPSTPNKGKGKGKNAKSKEVIKSFDWGLQPYKLVYPSSDVSIKEEQEFMNESKDGDIPAAARTADSHVRETLFWVMPSTSGRVVSHQLADKVKLFAGLRSALENVKSNTLDTSAMVALPLV